MELLYRLVLWGGLAAFFFAVHGPGRNYIALDELFPRAAGIHVNPVTLARYKELRLLHSRYEKWFVVNPTLYAAHYLTETRPVLPVMDATNLETAWQSGVAIAAAKVSGAVAFIENPETPDSTKPRGAPLVDFVIEHWEVVERRMYFTVYRAPE